MKLDKFSENNVFNSFKKLIKLASFFKNKDQEKLSNFEFFGKSLKYVETDLLCLNF